VKVILSFDEVSAPHHLRTRRIGNHIAIEVHIRLNGELSLTEAHLVTQKIETAIKSEFGNNTHIGIHMEPEK
jgi:divalent metal cation (Fe/Co/Zn/Cd) transporter